VDAGCCTVARVHPKIATSLRFTGQRENATIGLYFYNARYYDPALGRFTQPDTIVPQPGNPGGLNRYSYVLNNPIKYRDPTGHWVETAWDVLNIGWDIAEVKPPPSSTVHRPSSSVYKIAQTPQKGQMIGISRDEMIQSSRLRGAPTRVKSKKR